MRSLPDLELIPASVPRSATFLEAAEELAARRVPLLAVLDDGGRVAGLFGGQEVLAGLFPPYLSELRHTAFATDDPGLLDERARTVRTEPVERHMREAVVVDEETSAMHVAELFLHCGLGALAVLREGEFVGMLVRTEFVRAMLKRA
jgi:CBS domain-containing protein